MAPTSEVFHRPFTTADATAAAGLQPPPARTAPLPAPRPLLPLPPLPRAITVEPAVQPLVVIVDDDAGICYAFENYFVERGWQVRAVASGEQGLELLDDLRLLGQPVHLVLLDISLPGIDGVRAVELYRKLVQLNAQVIAMSAYHSPNLLRELRPHGVQIFIEKPVDLSHFDKLLASLPR